MIAPFDSGTTVKNLFYPYEEYTLTSSTQFLGLEGSTKAAGCLSQIEMPGYGFKALVPVAKWVGSAPSITAFLPGHDYRMLSKVGVDETETIGLQIQFSENMDCDSVTSSISLESNTNDNSIPTLDKSSISCKSVNVANNSTFSGGLSTAWTYSANLLNVANGIHQLIVTNASDAAKNSSTGVVDRFLFRIGQPDNPMIFPKAANYSNSLLYKNNNGSYMISHKAAGATMFRYSVDFRSSFSDWMLYTGGNTTLASKNWTGTSLQGWSGEHVYVQYWSNLSASSDHFQEGDLGNNGIPRRLPHMFVQGPFNQYSYDAGLPGAMKQYSNGTWYYDFMTEWPTNFQLNEWGLNPDGKPDQKSYFGRY